MKLDLENSDEKAEVDYADFLWASRYRWYVDEYGEIVRYDNGPIALGLEVLRRAAAAKRN